jgi:hypothetical protein
MLFEPKWLQTPYLCIGGPYGVVSEMEYGVSDWDYGKHLN